jgi:phosphate transport system substrate-binding protein
VPVNRRLFISGEIELMRNPSRSIVATLALALLVAACAGDGGTDTTAVDTADGGETGGGTVTGTLNISGSSTVEPITALVAEKFNVGEPGVAITVEGPGTGDGFARFCAGETDVSNASRAIDEEEIAACEAAGVAYTELLVAYDGMAVITNVNNEAVSCLNLGDLYALFGPESEGFSNWSDANELAAEVGGTGNFPDAPLNITAPGEESGTFDAFVELALAGIGEERLGDEYETNPTRADYNPSANDNVIVENVSAEDTALGWVGFAFAEEQADTLKEIPIDGGSGCIEPTIDTIADGSYPLSRPLYIYVSNTMLAEKPELAAFVDFDLGEGITSVAEVGYVDLPADVLGETIAAWEAVRG